jgi:hypothetical protein
MEDDFLIQNQCFLGHCIKTDSPYGTALENLTHAIDFREIEEVCASTIIHNDVAYTNYFAGLGIILRNPQVNFASTRDGGTTRLPDGELIVHFGHLEPTEEQVRDAVVNRETYNEFRVINYEVIGIFISGEDLGWAYATHSLRKTFVGLDELAEYHNLPLYILDHGVLHLTEYNAVDDELVRVRIVPVDEIYG